MLEEKKKAITAGKFETQESNREKNKHEEFKKHSETITDTIGLRPHHVKIPVPLRSSIVEQCSKKLKSEKVS